MGIGRLDYGAQENKKLDILAGSTARIQQVHTVIRRERPVVVFA